MSIAKEGLGVAGRVGFFFDKINAANLVGDFAEEMVVAAARTPGTKFTNAVKLTGVFLHEVLQ
jgi:hypothetical protein